MLPGFPEEPTGGWTSEGVRGLLSGTFGEAFFHEYGANEGLRILRDLGMGIRRTDYLEIRREVLDLERYEELIKALSPDTLVPRAWMNERPGIMLTSEAQYRFEIPVFNPETGEESVLYRSLADDSWWTPQEAEDQLSSWFPSGSKYKEWELGDATLRGVWIRPGAQLER